MIEERRAAGRAWASTRRRKGGPSTRSWPRSTRCREAEPDARPTRPGLPASASHFAEDLRPCRCAAHHGRRPARWPSRGGRVEPEIMIPLTGTVGEMKVTYKQTKEESRTGSSPRRACRALHDRHHDRGAGGPALHRRQQMAQDAEFFSFGTNDLTQMTLRLQPAMMSPSFLAPTICKKGLPASRSVLPVLDQEGVGRAHPHRHRARGARTRPDLKIGICGEPRPASRRRWSSVTRWA